MTATGSTARTVHGYTDRLAYGAGESMTVLAHTAGDSTPVDVDLVRMSAQGWRQTAWSAAGRYSCSPAPHCVGSFVAAEHVLTRGWPDTFTWGAWFWATMPENNGAQSLLGGWQGGAGAGLGIDAGAVTFTVHSLDHDPLVLRTWGGIRARTWYFIAGGVSGQEMWLSVRPVGTARIETITSRMRLTSPLRLPAVRYLAIGAAELQRLDSTRAIPIGAASENFNGKIEAPFLINRALDDRELAECAAGRTDTPLAPSANVIGAWQLGPAAAGPTERVRGVAGSPDALAVNLPARAVTGVTWTGEVTHFALAPEQYQAAHFHADDLADVGWRPLLEAKLPDDIGSGLYGVRLSTSQNVDVIPLTVVPASSSTARILVVVPVLTYLSYANEHMFEGDVSGLRGDIHLDDRDRLRTDHPEYGRSQYDTHADGSGVFFSSAARAILTMRTDYRMWLTESARGYAGELYLLRWLAEKGYAVDLVTDLELHSQGADLLARYPVVMTGAHPEYCTAEMLDGLRQYRDGGGNLMYLGGNGFYHVTGIYATNPLVTEIRRGNAGVRAWDSEPGETVLASTAQSGGLWRHRGRAPQQLAGVGFCAQGWDASAPYRRSEASHSPAVSWIFEGVTATEFGKTGEVRGGAAGDEIDRFDARLGAPPETVVVASSFGHSNNYQRAIEELTMTLPEHGGGTQDPEVHADMTYAELPGGGAFFATGSIAWTGSLSTDPAVSAITENVLRRFLGDSVSQPIRPLST